MAHSIFILFVWLHGRSTYGQPKVGTLAVTHASLCKPKGLLFKKHKLAIGHKVA